jgi:hypothetical protein
MLRRSLTVTIMSLTKKEGIVHMKVIRMEINKKMR